MNMPQVITDRLKRFDPTLSFRFNKESLEWEIIQKKGLHDDPWIVHTVRENNIGETMQLLFDARNGSMKDMIATHKKAQANKDRYERSETYALAKEVASFNQNPFVYGNL